MLRRLNRYVRPGAASVFDENLNAAGPSAQVSQPTQQDLQHRDQGKTDLQRFSQMRADISLELLGRIQEANLWISSSPPHGEGAVLKVETGEFISKPTVLKENNDSLYKAAELLNAKVCSFFFFFLLLLFLFFLRMIQPRK